MKENVCQGRSLAYLIVAYMKGGPDTGLNLPLHKGTSSKLLGRSF